MHKKLIVTIAAVSSLTGCAVMNPPKPLPAPAAPTAPQTTLKAAGLSHPQTVYVPAFYTGGSDNLLFINGQRYRAPNGAGNAMGFIPTATGYVVAVENTPVPTTITSSYGFPVGRLQSGSKLELFDVTKSGKTVREIAHLDLRPYDQVFQTKSAFYVQQPSGMLHDEAPNSYDKVIPLYSYFGLNAGGHHVSGPSNVFFATPGPNGGWYKLLPASLGGMMGGYNAELLHTKNGRILMVQKNHLGLFSHPTVYQHSIAAFVNEPPIVDSERTGYTLLMNFGVDPIDASQVDVTFGYCDLNQFSQSLTGTVSQSTSSLSPSEVLYFMNRYALVNTATGPAMVRQMGSHFSTLYTGLLNLKTKTKTPVFPLMGGTVNTVRIFLGNNNGAVSTANGKVDDFTVITPKGPVLIDANNSQIGTAYVVDAKQQIPASYAQEFASQYGMMP